MKKASVHNRWLSSTKQPLFVKPFRQSKYWRLLNVKLNIALVAMVVLFIACQKNDATKIGESLSATQAINLMPKISDFTVYGENSIWIKDRVNVVGGDIGVRKNGTGPFLFSGFEVALTSEAKVTASQNVIGNRVVLQDRVLVGDIQANQLVNQASTHTHLYPFPTNLPALPTLASVTPGTSAITITSGTTRVLDPGGYGTITIGYQGILRLRPGVFHLASLLLHDEARVEVLGAVQIRIAGRVSTLSRNSIVAAAGTILQAGEIRIEVGGRNGANGGLNELPKAAAFGNDLTLQGIVIVPNGTLSVGQRGRLTGALIGKDVLIDIDSDLAFQSGAGSLGCLPTLCDDNNPCTIDTCSVSVCKHTPVVAGTDCSDRNACNGIEICNESGGCQAGTPIVCMPSDQCHVAGVCNTETGICSNPIKINGSPCNDGNACTQSDLCTEGACLGTNPVICSSAPGCQIQPVCEPKTGICSPGSNCNICGNEVINAGEECDDGNVLGGDGCTSTCMNEFCGDGSVRRTLSYMFIKYLGRSCRTQGENIVFLLNGSEVGRAFLPDTCECQPEITTLEITDPQILALAKNGNNQLQVISTGEIAWVIGHIRTPNMEMELTLFDTDGGGDGEKRTQNLCEAHAGPTYYFYSLDLNGGEECDDGNTDNQDTCLTTCKNNQCFDVTCPPPLKCYDKGVCNPITRLCDYSITADGSTCDDENACTSLDQCISGTCIGTNPVVCMPSDDCHAAGTCDPLTGICTNPQKDNGSQCNDSNSCTQADTCFEGTCVGQIPVICTASDQCHNIGTCNPSTGLCDNPIKENGSSCTDGNACSLADSCQFGQCIPGNQVACIASDECHDSGVCNPLTGVCSNPIKLNGTRCNDGNACTKLDTCQNGICSGSNLIVCGASDQCHKAGICDSQTGLCSNPIVANGTACSDSNAFTKTDTCQLGVCIGGNKVVCSPSNTCHEVGSCNVLTGTCPSESVKSDGASCEDGNPVTENDLCQKGKCIPGHPSACIQVTSLEIGNAISCALWSDGKLWCWGGDQYLGLGAGDGTILTRNVPVQISGNWEKISVSQTNTCGIKSDGTLWCWGYFNGSGERRLSPYPMNGTDWEEIAVGDNSTCGIKINGTLWCWGQNGSGQVGDGTTVYRSMPVQIGTDSNWAGIAIGYAHTCGIKVDGTLWCWGANDYGQLGDETTIQRKVPTQIGIQKDWATVSSYYQNTCATRQNHTLWCWGYPSPWLLGKERITQANYPRQIKGQEWSDVRVGFNGACARDRNGDLFCWGENAYGTVGDGTNELRDIPIKVKGTDWNLFDLGKFHVCATSRNGSVWCWGRNFDAALGAGWNRSYSTSLPIQIAPPGCFETCRDGYKDWGEDCDDGNVNSGDGCGPDCKLEFCGDGQLQKTIGVQALEFTYLPLLSSTTNSWTDFKINGTNIGTNVSAYSTNTCNGDIAKFVVSDTKTLSLLRTGKNTIEFLSTSDIAWMKASIRGPGKQDIVVMEAQNGNANVGSRNACVEGRATRMIPHKYIFTVEGGEQCDDGNSNSGDGCNDHCGTAICGNKIVEANEQCDDGNTSANDGCSKVCQTEYCGDGLLQPSEGCDDGNIMTGDGCSDSCKIEKCAKVACPNCFGCDPISGACTLALPDGTGCNDGNACTKGDLCKSGVCVSGMPVVCVVDQCHSPGNCDKNTGLCSNVKGDGASCDDSNVCTKSDACKKGVCVGEDVLFADGDPCTFDSCDPVTGPKHEFINGPSCIQNNYPDLVPSEFDFSHILTDHQTLALTGEVSLKIINNGNQQTYFDFSVTVFLDRNQNQKPDGNDTILATKLMEAQGIGESKQIFLPVEGRGDFSGNLISVLVDSNYEIAESNEENNFINSSQSCRVIPPEQGFRAELQWSFSGVNVMMAPVVADLDQDGVPEVVVASFGNDGSYNCRNSQEELGTLRVLNGRTGEEKCHLNKAIACYSGLAVGDVDSDGIAEIITTTMNTRQVTAYGPDCIPKWNGDSLKRSGSGSSVSLADLDHDGRSEIIIGSEVFDSFGKTRWVGMGNGIGNQVCIGESISIVADLDMDGMSEIVAGRTAYRADGKIYWDRPFISDGYTAVANLDTDPYPEIVLVGSVNYPGQPATVTLLSHDGVTRWVESIPDGGPGGAPTIADMNGDGKPEIGIAGYQNYIVYKANGEILWKTRIHDYSSAVTGSTVFDFDGDGKVEVVYGDEENLWVFDGTTGSVIWSIPSYNRTWTEIPVVADVDGDGHAEIIKASFTLEGGEAAGVHVYGSPNRDWMNARKIWNQHSYHITNINDDLSIPAYETPSWQQTNTYRLNTVIEGCSGGRPDLVATYLHAVPEAGGRRVTVRIGNGGQTPVIPGQSVSFYEGDPKMGGTLLTTTKTKTTIHAGAYEEIVVNLVGLVRPIWASADDIGGLVGKIAELNELNNLTRELDNAAPVVSINGDLTVAWPAQSVSINGKVYDDGMPYGASLDVLWMQVSGPGQVVFSQIHSPLTKVSFPVPGSYQLELQATDGVLAGKAVIQVTVQEPIINHAPLVDVSGPTKVDLPSGKASLVASVQDDGLPLGNTVHLAWLKVSGPGNINFDPETQSATTVTFSKEGTYVLHLEATDGELTGFGRVVIIVAPRNNAPVVDAGPNQILNYPAKSVELFGTATDDGLPISSELVLSWTQVSGPGPVTFTSPLKATTTAIFKYPGTYTVRLTGSDGEFTHTSSTTIVVGAQPGAAPNVILTKPRDGDVITSQTDFTGWVSNGEWRLEYRLGGEEEEGPWQMIASGEGQVFWGKLGTIDPTMMLNGLYAIRLISTTAEGEARATNHVSIEKNQKIGNFTVSFNDLSVPSTGLPIEITRTYDSRDKTSGDFGIGWNVSLRNIRVETSGVLGKAWNNQRQTGIWPTYCLAQAQARFVAVTFPTGKVYRFRSTTDPECESFSKVDLANMIFKGEPGTYAELDAVGAEGLIANEGSLFDSDMRPYNPTLFTLTTQDGMKYKLEKKKGLLWLQDRNGNTVTMTPDGVTHSSGKGVTFQRDGMGRIVRMVDQSGNALRYDYDPDGKLISVWDREGQQTRYSYRNGQLLGIIDPRNTTVINNEYGVDGRLVKTTDANGKSVQYTHNLRENQEVITDRTGKQKVLDYDTDGNVVRETDAAGGTITRTFDSQDNRLSETDALGNTTLWTYDAAGNVVEVTNALGKKTKTTYSGFNQVLTEKDALGRVTANTYDNGGNLRFIKDAYGGVTEIQYDRSGNQISRTTRTGHTTSYGYDSFGNMDTEVNPQGKTSIFAYDSNNNRIRETRTRTKEDGTQETLVTRNTYDKNNRLLSTTHPDGSVTGTTYNAAGLRETTTDSLGRVTRFTYDDAGRLTQTSFPDGTTTSSTYDEEGRRLTSTDQGGRVTTMEYDDTGRLVKTTHPDGTFTSTAYYLNGWVFSTTDEKNHTTLYEYDPTGRQTKVTDAQGKETTFTYDTVGNQLTVTDARGNTTTSVYDALNRLVTTKFPDDTQRTTTYDKESQRIAETDQAGKSTTFAYDALGRLSSVTDALNQTTQYQYDELGNRILVIDAAGKQTKFAYDKLGRETKRILPDGKFEVKGYNLGGELISRTDFQGRTTTYSYDVGGLLTGKTYPDSTTVGFTYTPTGRRLSAIDTRGTTKYTYNDRDRLTTLEYPNGRRLEYGYDASGNRTTLTAKVGTTTLTTTYTHDVLDRIASVTDPNGRVFGMEYDNVGSLAKLVRPNGVDTTYTHDGQNRLTNVRTAMRATDATIASYAYTLGPTGIRTKIDEGDGTARSYQYDDLYRLTKETVTGGTGPAYEKSFAYDAVSNRMSQVTTGTGAGSVGYTYDSRDRLMSEGGTAYGWTDNGNLMSKAGDASYEWDFEDRLVKVVKGDGTLVENVYDVDGVMVRTKVIPSGGTPQTTDLLVDTSGGLSHVVAEVDGTGTVTTLYVRAGDMLLEEIRGGAAKMYEADALGSVRSLLDVSGARTDAYTYEAFGSTLSTGTDANPYRFAGERLVEAAGMYQNRARWLDTGTGRFVSVDKYVLPEDQDDDSPPVLPLSYLYVYAYADPIDYIDPRGEFEFTLVGLTITVNIQGILRSFEGSGKAAASRVAHRELAQLGVRSYNEMKYLQRIGKLPKFDAITKEALEVHHIFEKRLLTYGNNRLRQLFSAQGEIPSILMTKTQHQLITSAWRNLIPRRSMAKFFQPNLEQIMEAAAKVHAGNPMVLKEILLIVAL